MKRIFAVSAFSFAFVGLVFANPSRTLSPLVHDAWQRCESKAVAAAAVGDYTHALALLDGGIYSGGVSLGLNESSLGRNRARAHVAFARATQYWQDALGSDCPLRVSTPGEVPQTLVSLVDAIPGDGGELGLIEMKKSYQWTAASFTCGTKAKISVMRSFERKPLSEEEMTEVMAHEIGHLLGLADVEQPGFLMGPMDRDHLTHGPTQTEVDAVVSMRHDFKASYRMYLGNARLNRP